MPITVDNIENAKDIVEFWKYDSAGLLVQAKIKKEARLNNIVAIAICIIGLPVLALFIVPFDDDDDFFFPFLAFEKFFPQWKLLLTLGLRSFFPFCGILLQSSFYIIIYSNLRIKFQIYMLTEFLKNLNCGYSNLETSELLNNTEYQNEIFKRLKFCIERQEHIYR